MNQANGPPPRDSVGGRRFYVIQDREDGNVDVYLFPPRATACRQARVSPASCPNGLRLQAQSPLCGDAHCPFEGVTLVVRGVVLPEGQGEDAPARRLNAVGRLAEDVRARYYAWCKEASPVCEACPFGTADGSIKD